QRYFFFGTKASSKKPAPIVENRVADGGHQQRQQQAKRLATDDHDSRGPTLLGAWPRAEGERNHARHQRERGHEDRSQAVPVGLKDGGMTVQAAGAQIVHVVDLQDRVFLYHTEQDEDAQGGIEVDRLAASPQGEQGKGDGDGQRKQDG